MKPKSFDCNLTRALLKLGFGKSGTSGRYVNWIIPDALWAYKSEEALMTVEKPSSQKDDDMYTTGGKIKKSNATNNVLLHMTLLKEY